MNQKEIKEGTFTFASEEHILEVFWNNKAQTFSSLLSDTNRLIQKYNLCPKT